MTSNWTIDKGDYGPRMVMHGPWSSAAGQAARSARITELVLNHAKGWSGRDISFLVDVADLLISFTIIDFAIKDISAVNLLTSLEMLDINTYCKTEIRFSQFPALEECALEWRAKASSIFAHAGIKRLFINKYSGKDLTRFSQMVRLESLALASPRVETLDGIETLTALSFLGIYVARQLTSLQGIEALTNLTRLEVNDCRKIGDLAPIAGLRGLRELHVCNDGEIASFRPLANLHDLELVLFYESTNVLDGDLGVLTRLPKLQRVAFMERKHYTHRRSDFLREGT